MIASIKPNKPFLIGIAGGSGSGKTYFARELHRLLGAEKASIIYQDNFYIDQSRRFDFDGGSVNFDHPESLDFKRLEACLTDLNRGQPTRIPIYDFVSHTRSVETLEIQPTPIILIDGILIFHPEAVRKQFDHLIFFDAPESLRFERRLKRDVEDRGRTPEGVRNQFEKQVKPMHDQFVQPSRVHAHEVIQDLGQYERILQQTLQLCLRRIP